MYPLLFDSQYLMASGVLKLVAPEWLQAPAGWPWWTLHHRTDSNASSGTSWQTTASLGGPMDSQEHWRFSPVYCLIKEEETIRKSLKTMYLAIWKTVSSGPLHMCRIVVGYLHKGPSLIISGTVLVASENWYKWSWRLLITAKLGSQYSSSYSKQRQSMTGYLGKLCHGWS